MGSTNTVRVVSWAFSLVSQSLTRWRYYSHLVRLLSCATRRRCCRFRCGWHLPRSVCKTHRCKEESVRRRRCFVTAERDTKAVYPTRTKCSDNYCSYLSSEMGVWTTRVPSTQHEQRRATNRVSSRVQMITTNLLLLPNVVVSNGNLPQA